MKMMFKKLKQKIESKRNSKKIFWKSLIFCKDAVWWLQQDKHELMLRIFYELMLRINARHLYGPKKIDYGKNEVIVVCLVKDGEEYIKSFIEHYFYLGFKHIVFMDNDSTDKTVSIAKNYKNVTILQTNLPYKIYKFKIKEYLVKHFSKNRWCLCADIDEFFDYPFSDVLDLNCFISYLNNKQYTCVVAQMLDMFSNKSLCSLKGKSDLKNYYNYFDISNVIKEDYPSNLNNYISNQDIKFYHGGIRKKLFNLNVWLTKHPLIFFDNKIKPFVNSSNILTKARIADVTCVFFHYLFTKRFYDKVFRVVKEESYIKNSYEYKKIYKVLKNKPDMVIKQKTSKKFENINKLIDHGFLVVSDDYIKLVKKKIK